MILEYICKNMRLFEKEPKSSTLLFLKHIFKTLHNPLYASLPRDLWAVLFFKELFLVLCIAPCADPQTKKQ